MTNHVTDTNVGKMTEEEAILMQEAFKRLYLASHIQEACNIAIEALKFQQSVVRCKDCKYITSRSTCDYWSSIEWFGKYVEDDDYCSQGIRRDEE